MHERHRMGGPGATNMELDWLNDFTALAELGNFSRAADARHVTQPAFSRRIRALEEWIGTPLFVRSAQGAALTPAGVQFRSLAGEMLRTIERARRDTLAVGQRHTTSLSFAATHALSFTFFPGWIRRHASLDAFGTLNLISDSMEACEQIMLSGEVHFLLCHYHRAAPAHFDPQRYASKCVGSDKLMALCAPDVDGRPTWPINDARRRPTRLLSYSQASGLGRILAAHHAAAFEIADGDTVFTSHLAATLLTMARDGQGVAWLPATLTEEDVKLGRLVRAGTAISDIPVEIRLFRSPDCRNAAADRLWGVSGSAGD